MTLVPEQALWTTEMNDSGSQWVPGQAMARADRDCFLMRC